MTATATRARGTALADLLHRVRARCERCLHAAFGDRVAVADEQRRRFLRGLDPTMLGHPNYWVYLGPGVQDGLIPATRCGFLRS